MMKNQKTILLNGSHPDYLVNLRGDLIRKLVSLGHQVHVTSPDLDRDASEKLVDMGATVHGVALSRRALNPISDLKYLIAMLSLIRRIQPDYVIGYTIKPNIWASIAARLARVRYGFMVTGLGYAFIPSGNRFRRWLQTAVHRLYRIASSGATAVLFQNPDDVQDFCAAGCLGDRSKAKITNGSGVNVDYFAQASLPLDNSYLFIGRLLRTKGVREYVHAGLELKQSYPEAKIRLAGFLDFGPDAITQDELDEWIKGGVEFLGKLSDIRPAMADSDVYVLPSYREGTPRTVLEAMSMGRAVITTDAPGCRETVECGKNGLLVSVKNVGELAEAMELFYGNSELKKEYGNRSRAIAEEKYAVEKVNESMIDYFELNPDPGYSPG